MSFSLSPLLTWDIYLFSCVFTSLPTTRKLVNSQARANLQPCASQDSLLVMNRNKLKLAQQKRREEKGRKVERDGRSWGKGWTQGLGRRTGPKVAFFSVSLSLAHVIAHHWGFIVSPLDPWVQHLWIHPNLDWNTSNTEGWLYYAIYIRDLSICGFWYP